MTVQVYVEHTVGQQRPNKDRDAVELSSLKWNIRRDRRCGTMYTLSARKQSLNWTCVGTSIQCSLVWISLVTWLCQGSPRTSRAAALVTPGIDEVGRSEQSDSEKSVPIIKSRYDHCTNKNESTFNDLRINRSCQTLIWVDAHDTWNCKKYHCKLILAPKNKI